MAEKHNYDVEYHASDDKHRHHSLVPPDETGAVHGELLVAGDTFTAKLQRLVTRFGVEARGIERVPEDERTDKTTVKVGTMWCAANMVVSTFALGCLSVPLFGLGFVDSILTVFFINAFSVLPVCFFSTLGPKFGLRQMILSRFYFGFYGVKLSTSDVS
jgi:cytosine/uracil/thiamine/allantoin permease